MLTFLDQKLDASSSEKSTPPIGAPNAAARLEQNQNFRPISKHYIYIYIYILSFVFWKWDMELV